VAVDPRFSKLPSLAAADQGRWAIPGTLTFQSGLLLTTVQFGL